MQWTDDGIVLGIRRHGESSAILELMTRDHGRHLGLVRGGFGSRLQPVLQPGNAVSATWRARLDDHLGHYTVEGTQLRAAGYFRLPHAVYGLGHLAGLMRLLPERDPHQSLYALLDTILDRLENAGQVAPLIVQFELGLLAELGFGLDLASCASTGVTDDLVYVSPKSGRAVSRAAGAPWAERMLPLPSFLACEEQPSHQDVQDGFVLTGYFLEQYVIEQRGTTLPDARAHFIAAIARALPSAA